MRRLVPLLVVPFAVLACGLASSPWLRAFPSGVIGVPLYGAVLLSVLTPVVVVGIGVRRLWLNALIDLVLLIFYELLVTLRAPGGFPELWNGLIHGPAMILSYALPLVSPRTLLVAPVALCWVAGAIVGECLARGWRTIVPYIVLIATFGLAYGGSVRAVSSAADGQRYDTVLAVSLLVTLLLLRAANAWVNQDESADATQPGAALPLRGLALGVGTALLIGVGATGLAQTSALTGPPRAPARIPPLDRSDPFSPLSLISGLRPANPDAAGRPVFTLITDSPGSAYIPIADVDDYDGDGWSFQRTFRPSGGVLPADADPALRPSGPSTTQQYTIAAGPLTGTPWMPYLYRPKRVSGLGVDIDETSGMIVPAHRLRAGESYTVQSSVTRSPFGRVPATSVPAGYSPANLQLPSGGVRESLTALARSLSLETGTPTTSAVTFLQSVARYFQTRFGLAGGRGVAGSSAPASTAGRTGSSPAPVVQSTPVDAQRAGGTSFADVLASIQQFRSATPEQYATLMCLLARQVGVPARVATGFRLSTRPGRVTLPAGRYTVRTSQAWTWVEIPVAGSGWVVLDPSPTRYSGERPPPDAGSTPSPTPSPSSSPNASIAPTSAGRRPAPPSIVPHRGAASTGATTLIVVLVVLVLLAGLLALLLLRKRWRAARRRRGDPRARLLGAWRETLDVLEEAGMPSLRAATSREVAAATQERFGPQPALAVRQLGDAANAAIFHPAAPVTVADADAAWTAHAALARGVRDSLGRRARLQTMLRYRRHTDDRPAPGPATWVDEHGNPAPENPRYRPLHR